MTPLSKPDLRKAILEKRDKIPPVIRTRDSAIIRQRLFQQTAWADAGTILSYLSFGSEVDTHKLLPEALQKSKRMVVPVCDATKQELSLSELHRMGDLAPGPYGIYEPSPVWRKAVDPSEVELVLVPGIAFDRQGGRLGFGAGYFDKLLSRMPRAVRIGLAFSVQLLEESLPMEAHDIRMSFIVTENDWIEVKS